MIRATSGVDPHRLLITLADFVGCGVLCRGAKVISGRLKKGLSDNKNFINSCLGFYLLNFPVAIFN